jgi:hypothetical protein
LSLAFLVHTSYNRQCYEIVIAGTKFERRCTNGKSEEKRASGNSVGKGKDKTIFDG